MRISRWAKAGVLDRVLTKLQQLQILTVKIEVLSLDSTSIKVHPDGNGALKKMDNSPLECLAADATGKFIWLPPMTGQR